jgi:hypothetical protein
MGNVLAINSEHIVLLHVENTKVVVKGMKYSAH